MSAALPLRYLLLLFLGSLSTCLVAADNAPDPFANPPRPAFAGQTDAPRASTSAIQMEVILADLEPGRPRAIDALPDGSLMVAEGSGRVRILQADGSVSAPLTGLPPFRSGGSRILMDIELDADFASNRRVFLAMKLRVKTAPWNRWPAPDSRPTCAVLKTCRFWATCPADD